MSRPRALIALLLAAIWCSAAWHVELEVAGLMLEHSHHGHAAHDDGHCAADSAHDGLENVVARDVAKDQVRIDADSASRTVFFGLALWLAAALRPLRLARLAPRRRRESDPPFAQPWQFHLRCAPLSAAPPAQALS